MGTEQDSTPPSGRGERIDFDEVARLVSALEQDLAKVSAGSKDVQALRDEVEALRTLLHSAPGHEAIEDRLHGIKNHFETTRSPVLLEAIREGQYLAMIGRILGLS